MSMAEKKVRCVEDKAKKLYMTEPHRWPTGYQIGQVEAYIEGYKAAIAEIMRIEDLEKDKWIPVSERLPEAYQEVRAWTGDCEIHAYHGNLPYSSEAVTTWFSDDSTGVGQRVAEPTHWQEITSPTPISTEKER